jgi:hypothetical protein
VFALVAGVTFLVFTPVYWLFSHRLGGEGYGKSARYTVRIFQPVGPVLLLVGILLVAL